MIKNSVFISRSILALLIFALCVTYRVILWEDFSKNWYHVILNASFDTVIGFGCGLLVYALKTPPNRLLFYLLITAIIIGFSVLLYFIHMFVYIRSGIYSESFSQFFTSICFQLLDSLGVVVLGCAGVIIQRQQEENQKNVDRMHQLINENTKVELQYLKSQIDPHFVFNGLNMIYHEMEQSQGSARESILQFADILRYHLQYKEQEKVTLQREIAYLTAYIHFQKKRSPEHYTVTENISCSQPDVIIEPLLILPIVENAFKYCKPQEGTKGHISFSLQSQDRHFSFTSVNSCANAPGIGRLAGHGLDNLEKRLRLLYPGKYKLRPSYSPENETFQCTLDLYL